MSNDLRLKAYSSTSTGDYRQIITGVSERGSATTIKYWIQPRRTQPVQPRSKSAKEEMVELLEYFIKHVSQDDFLSFS
jgi:hypothetical protein